MAIWQVVPDIQALNKLHEGTAVAHLGIEIADVGDDYLVGRMPVDERTKQPFGLMHGGSAALLLETLASAAANHCVDPACQMCVGLELNCNHVRGVRSGFVVGRARALHIGRRSMVWSLEAHDDADRLATVGRITLAIVQLPSKEG